MKQYLGIGLIVTSVLPWLAIAALPWVPLAGKGLLVPALLGLAEVMFWLGVLLAGKAVAERYRFSPRKWWAQRRSGRQ